MNKKVILLNMMFSGDYLKSNIGHEVINLFKSDNGCSYVYVNPYGYIADKYEAESILMVQMVERNLLKVIAKATGLDLVSVHEKDDVLIKDYNVKSQYKKMVEANQKYIIKEKITYGGIRLDELFHKQADQVCVSYKAKSVKIAKTDFYIAITKGKDESNVYEDKNGRIVHGLTKRENGWQFSTQSLHMLIPSDQPDYTDVKRIIDDKTLWQDTEIKPISHDVNADKDSFLSIIRKEYDELSYSNMIAYYLEHSKTVLRKFIAWLNEKDKEIVLPDNNDKILVLREFKRIDILIRYGKTGIIIENKIKSDVNRSKADKESESYRDQLPRYIEEMICQYYIEDKNQTETFKAIKEKCTQDEINGWLKNIHPFILHPNYSHLNITSSPLKKYIDITYQDIYNFFNGLSHEEVKDLPWFDEFLKALEIQSTVVDESNFRTMKQRFLTEIEMHRNTK